MVSCALPTAIASFFPDRFAHSRAASIMAFSLIRMVIAGSSLDSDSTNHTANQVVWGELSNCRTLLGLNVLESQAHLLYSPTSWWPARK